MASNTNTLELLFTKLHEGDYDSVTNLIPDAVREYKRVLVELNRGERMKVNYIKSLLDYCNSGRWEMVSHQLSPAEEEYYRYFYRKNTPKSRRPAKVEFDLRNDNDTEHDQRRSRQASRHSDDERPTSERTPRKTSRVSTDMSDLSTAANIVNKFGELYKNEWRDALDELEKLKVNEIDAITGLLRILMDAYKYCTVEADSQLSKLEQAILNIMMEGVSISPKFDGDKSYLSAYRKGMACVCLHRLQESFKRRYLPEIIRSVGIYQNLLLHGPVHKYAEQCVAISWAMGVLDPQIFLVDDRSKHGAFNKEMYNEYKTPGQSVAFYVWPPLQTSKFGKLLSKGIAQCHL
ncbi:hypothetical protein ACF0H5_010085 [Mactra antiquata]